MSVNNKCEGYYPSPIGVLKITFTGEGIWSILFDVEEKPNYDCNHLNEDSIIKINKLIFEQLNDYFKGEREKFNIPYVINGTKFQIKVWKEIMKIPYGETRSYSDIAKKIGNKRAVRAVGNASKNNPLPIIIPCHRVVSKDGKLRAYNGGIWRKKWLLENEYKMANI